MGKIRVYTFAKLLKISNDEAVAILRRHGLEVKSNLSSIDEKLVAEFQSGAVSRPRGEDGSRDTVSSATKSDAQTAPKPTKSKTAPKTSRKAATGKRVRARTVEKTAPETTLKPPAGPPARKSHAAKAGPASPVAAHSPETSPKAVSSAASTPEVTSGGVPASRGPSEPAKPRLVPPAAPKPVPAAPQALPTPPPPPRAVTLTEGVTVKELSEKTDLKSKDIIKKLLDRGILATINQPLEIELAKQICREFGYEPQIISFEEDAIREHKTSGRTANLCPRDPVVTIMGHVDHGKTSLLDSIRQSKITEREHGGITQHIGAYHVQVRGRGITFIDTPGHEAFTLMRSRGAKVTDVVVLVVAADDGVMPQTLEAIDHARAANVPMVVAINKIDKPNANLDRVKKALSDHGLLVEDWGGDVVSVAISAKQKLHIDDLLDMILLVADLHELKADPDLPATGAILEAKLDKARGPVATVLVQEGTLHVGDAFIAGAVNGKVRAMFDDRGRKMNQAGPSIPAEVLGLQGVARAGDPFQVVIDEFKARQIGSFRQSKIRQEGLAKSSRLTLDHLFQQIKEGAIKELPIILKGDVQGSVEVLAKSLLELATDQVKVRIIHSATGAITETDILLASASNAIVVGFNVRPDRSATELAEKEKVDIRLHTVIYDVHNEIRSAMVGLLEPTYQEQYLGRAEVRNVFKIPKVGMVAGTHVSDGRMLRGSQVRLLRDNVIVHQGRMASLKRFKDDVGEVKAGYECGIALEKFNDLKVGDVIEAYRIERIIPKAL
jgi:translation initiation factor IF-2